MHSIDDLLRLALDRAAAVPFPESTYRVQLHAGFTFADAKAIVPYLHELGITHLYFSPYLRARPGSTHGYDVIDHTRLNPELGTDADYAALVEELQKYGLSHVLDTVPNHVGVGTNDNAWWNDVLANGPASRYAKFFDIDWQGSPRPEMRDKVLLPVLGEPYAEALEKGHLKVVFDAERGEFSVNYYDRRFPIAAGSLTVILHCAAEEMTGTDELVMLALECERLHDPHPRSHFVWRDEHVSIRKKLASLTTAHGAIHRSVETLNGTPGDPRSFDTLNHLLSQQSYRLAHWVLASDEINYRRFFDINDLAALSMERPEVFDATHALILGRLARGDIGGLRIDHPDGLLDPAGYFVRLQEQYVLSLARELFDAEPGRFGKSWDAVRDALSAGVRRELPRHNAGPRRWPLYVVAEKILALGEPLPRGWAVHGTSGYDFLILANGLFVDQGSADAFTDAYHELTGEQTSFADLVYAKKKLILEISLASELRMLAHRLDRLSQKDRHWRDFSFNGILAGLREVIACFPVYRTYVCGDTVCETDVARVEQSIEEAIRRNPQTSPRIFHFIRDALLLRAPDGLDGAAREELRTFAGKFQQVTAPTTAKGIEDTSFYIYNRFVSLNEVGGEPAHFGTSPEQLHAYLADRQRHWPYAMSCLSTHDTKRSEDVRARLNVLSEMPDEWRSRVTRWYELNAPHRRDVDGAPAPSRNDEYLLYQTLVGAWPLDAGADVSDPPAKGKPIDCGDFVGRIQAYMRKAIREAKVHTSWTRPNDAYETAMNDFIAAVLDPHRGGAFLADLTPFVQRVSRFGLLGSLSQTVLRLTAPGVPDTYQGTELWDFSLVDPDNRRPVDYALRRTMLAELRRRHGATGAERAAFLAELLAHTPDGRAKLYLTWRLLDVRRQNAGLFTEGEYLPLEVRGSRAAHVFAFARRAADRWAIVAIPRLLLGLGLEPPAPFGSRDGWSDTRLTIPDGAPQRWRDVLGGREIEAHEGGLALADACSAWPAAVLMV